MRLTGLEVLKGNPSFEVLGGLSSGWGAGTLGAVDVGLQGVKAVVPLKSRACREQRFRF